MKFADNLVGKGLSAWIIIKLIVLSLGWMFVLTVPMAVLIATLMAFGSMSQNNEITILKSSGISLYKMMIPPLIGAAVVTFLLIQFNNYVYPNTNYALRLLQQDVSRKKPTLSLVPGVFSQEVSNYSILARTIDQNTNELGGITIYDYSDYQTPHIVTAKHGKIYFSKDQKKLILDLYEGEIHETKENDPFVYRRMKFNRHKIAMDANQFSFEQTAPGAPRGDRELGAQDMLLIVDSLAAIQNNYENEYETNLNKNLLIANEKQSAEKITTKQVYLKVQEKLRSTQIAINSVIQRMSYNENEMNRYRVEINKRYSLPFACIVFVLIGAPLGTMTRKGGIGMAAGISLFFFLIYWAFLIGGEKLADRNLVSPFWGIWSANFVLGALGIFFTIKSAKERVSINFDFLKKFIPKRWGIISGNDENNS